MRVIVLAVYIVIGAALDMWLRWLLAPALPFIAAWELPLRLAAG